MKKLLGIAGLLLVIAVITTLLSHDEGSGNYTFLSAYNLENLLRRLGMFGVLSIAAAFVIVTGGIDLSIGSVVCVAGCVLRRLGACPPRDRPGLVYQSLLLCNKDKDKHTLKAKEALKAHALAHVSERAAKAKAAEAKSGAAGQPPSALTLPGVRSVGAAYTLVKMARYCLMFWLPYFLSTYVLLSPAAAGSVAALAQLTRNKGDAIGDDGSAACCWPWRRCSFMDCGASTGATFWKRTARRGGAVSPRTSRSCRC